MEKPKKKQMGLQTHLCSDQEFVDTLAWHRQNMVPQPTTRRVLSRRMPGAVSVLRISALSR